MALSLKDSCSEQFARNRPPPPRGEAWAVYVERVVMHPSDALNPNRPRNAQSLDWAPAGVLRSV
jgi:hypothetical protein